MLGPEPVKLINLREARGILMCFTLSAERQAVVVAVSAALRVANRPRSASSIHDNPASMVVSRGNGSGLEYSAGGSSKAFSTSDSDSSGQSSAWTGESSCGTSGQGDETGGGGEEDDNGSGARGLHFHLGAFGEEGEDFSGSSGSSSILCMSSRSDSSRQSSARTEDSSYGCSGQGEETTDEEDDDSSGTRMLQFYPGAFGDDGENSSHSDADTVPSPIPLSSVWSSPMEGQDDVGEEAAGVAVPDSADLDTVPPASPGAPLEAAAAELAVANLPGQYWYTNFAALPRVLESLIEEESVTGAGEIASVDSVLDGSDWRVCGGWGSDFGNDGGDRERRRRIGTFSSVTRKEQRQVIYPMPCWWLAVAAAVLTVVRRRVLPPRTKWFGSRRTGLSDRA